MAFAITGPAGLVSPLRFSEALPALEFNAADNAGPVEWSVNYGAMFPAVGNGSILNPLNLTRTVVVTGKDTGTDPWTEATAEFEMEAMFPVEASRDLESDLDMGLEFSEPEKGQPKVRLLQMSGKWPLEFRVRHFMELAAIRAFLVDHRGLPFWYQDTYLGELVKGYQVSSWRRKPSFTNLHAYSFQFQCWDYQPPANIADVGPFKPAEVPEYGEGEFGG